MHHFIETSKADTLHYSACAGVDGGRRIEAKCCHLNPAHPNLKRATAQEKRIRHRQYQPRTDSKSPLDRYRNLWNVWGSLLGIPQGDPP